MQRRAATSFVFCESGIPIFFRENLLIAEAGIGGMRAHARSFTCYLKSCIPLRGSLQGDVFASIDHKGSYLSQVFQVFHSLQVDFQNNLEHMGIW